MIQQVWLWEAERERDTQGGRGRQECRRKGHAHCLQAHWLDRTIATSSGLLLVGPADALEANPVMEEEEGGGDVRI